MRDRKHNNPPSHWIKLILCLGRLRYLLLVEETMQCWVRWDRSICLSCIMIVRLLCTSQVRRLGETKMAICPLFSWVRVTEAQFSLTIQPKTTWSKARQETFSVKSIASLMCVEVSLTKIGHPSSLEQFSLMTAQLCHGLILSCREETLAMIVCRFQTHSKTCQL